MNIPQDTLQAVADAAVIEACKRTPHHYRLATDPDEAFWTREGAIRRAVIQYALDNPALAPWLNVSQAWPQVVEYTDSDIHCAWRKAVESDAKFVDRIRAFLAALPRRESPALVSGSWSVSYNNDDNGAFSEWWDVESTTGSYRAFSEEAAQRLCDILNAKQSPTLAEAIARAEKAEAERDFERSTADEELARSDRTYAQICKAARSVGWINMAESGPITTFIRKIGDELSALKSAQLGILRPIAEMPETVPDGCMAVFRWRDDFGSWVTGTCKPTNGFFAILRLPDAEFTPPAEFAAQVPLGPEDVPPGSVFRSKDQPDTSFWTVSQVWERGFYLRGECVDWHLAMERMEINTSIPDTGRWDATAWRPCSKPGKEVAK